MKSDRGFGEIQDWAKAINVITTIITPMLDLCAKRWEEEVDYTFESQGAPVGGWEPTTMATQDLRKAMGYPPGPILNMRGVLRKSKTAIPYIGVDGAGVNLMWGSPERRQGRDVYGVFIAGEKTWDGKDLAGLHHQGGGGYNPLTGKTFGVPSRPLYSEFRLTEIFQETVEEPFRMAIDGLIVNMLGGK